MTDFWSNVYVVTILYFLVAVIAIAVFVWIFEAITRYDDMEQIKKGNLSVAMVTGGKLFGIANILRFALIENDTIWQALLWGVIGFVLLVVAYYLFDFLTPRFKVDEEVEKDNRAVGLLSMSISIALSYVIGASIV